jgi:hypothetical protein
MGVYKQMRNAVPALALIAVAGSLTGCGILSNRGAPDEFQVVSRAPLEVPPDFSLRPPQPGSPRPQELDRDTRAQSSMFGASSAGSGALIDPRKNPSQSSGEGALLALAGADQANPDIRTIVDRENPGVVVADKSLVDRLLFWKDDAPNPEIVQPGQAPTITRKESTAQ